MLKRAPEKSKAPKKAKSKVPSNKLSHKPSGCDATCIRAQDELSAKIQLVPDAPTLVYICDGVEIPLIRNRYCYSISALSRSGSIGIYQRLALTLRFCGENYNCNLK